MAEGKTPNRFSVTLDEERARKLEKLQEGCGDSKAEIFRTALDFMFTADEFGFSPEDVDTYLGLANSKSTVILHKRIFASLISKAKESSDLRDGAHELGKEAYELFISPRDMDLMDYLDLLDKSNLCEITRGEDPITIFCTVPELQDLFKSFLEGVLDQYDSEKEIKEFPQGLILGEFSED